MFKPVKEMVMLKEIKATQTTGGIFIPETNREDPLQALKGKVSAIGPDVLELKVGDVVFFNHFKGKNLFDLDGTPGDVWVINEADVIAVI